RERVIARSHVPKIRLGESDLPALGVNFFETDEFLRFRVWKRTQQHRIHDAEDRRASADAQAESERSDGSEPGLLQQHPRAVAQILTYCFNAWDAASKFQSVEHLPPSSAPGSFQNQYRRAMSVAARRPEPQLVQDRQVERALIIMRLPLKHKRVEAVARADHDVLAAIQHICLGRVAGVGGQAGVPQRLSAQRFVSHKIARAVAAEQQSARRAQQTLSADQRRMLPYDLAGLILADPQA